MLTSQILGTGQEKLKNGPSKQQYHGHHEQQLPHSKDDVLFACKTTACFMLLYTYRVKLGVEGWDGG